MLRTEILGTWALVSYTASDDQGGPVTHPFGPDAIGLIIYASDGYMSAQIMRPDRPTFDRSDIAGGSTEQTTEAARGYLAYSGPFEVDERSGVLRHHVTVSLLPNWVGRPQVRHSHLDGDYLTLSASVIARSGITRIGTLVWKRVAPSTLA